MKRKSRENLVEMLTDLKMGLFKIKDIILENIDFFEDYIRDYPQMSENEIIKLLSKMKTNDTTIRSLGQSLEQSSVRILSLQAPVSRDLRLVLSSFRMIYDLERISRDAYNALRDMNKIKPENEAYFEEQFRLIIKVLENTRLLLKYFREMYDKKLIEGGFDYSGYVDDTVKLDNEIDDLYENHSKNIIKAANENKIKPDSAHYILASLRSLERTGDHCCNLIERSIYIQTGDRLTIK